MIGTALRCLLLDLPYLILLLAALALGLLKHYQEAFYDPLLETLVWSEERAEQEMTYYGRVCSTQEATAHTPEELLLSPDMTPDQVVDSMLTHGVSIFPNLIKPETARALRETIVEHNHIEENFGVISNNQRWSYGIRMEQHPVVRQALREVASNPLLRSALKPLLGENPAIYKLHAITSGYGAGDQFFHWDVKAESSSQQFARSFAPIYSLFIPLQDTPKSMGATQMCPGSHVCADGTTFCADTAFQVVFDSNSTEYPGELVWPTGYGALMNQQTTHRGRAHMLEGGPDRVLFTLAITPRPRSNHIAQLETRSLSLGGSYAIHFTQWAHTWNDFLEETMYNPVKTIRSLGIYKPKNTQWGRDLPFTVLLQVANGDYLDQDDVWSFFENGEMGYWNRIPRYLHASYPSPAMYQDENSDPGAVWYSWVIQTLDNCRKELERWALAGLVVYNFVIVGLNLLFCSLGLISSQALLHNLQNWIKRVVLLHLIIGLCTLSIYKKMHQTPWARHIESGKAYALSKHYRGPSLPSTLPTKEDILMLDDFQSEYLASYTRMYQVAHPGNAAWNGMVNGYAGHYQELPISLQSDLCNDMATWVGQEHRRFLIKNDVNQWARMTPEMSKQFVHKELMRASNPFVGAALQQVAYLQSETKFGTWRDTVLHRRSIPEMLSRLEDKIVQASKPRYKLSKGSSNLIRLFPVTRSSTALPTGSKPSIPSRNSLPPRGEESEPFWGAWLQVGDTVDSIKYIEDDNRWYHGKIVEAIGSIMKWGVDISDTGERVYPCLHCVKPFTPLEVGLEFDLPGIGFGEIVGIDNSEETFDFSPYYTKLTRRNIPFSRLARGAAYDQITDYLPDLGENVLVDVEGQLVLGLVVSAREDTYEEPQFTIAFYDGEEEFNVPAKRIRPLHFDSH